MLDPVAYRVRSEQGAEQPADVVRPGAGVDALELEREQGGHARRQGVGAAEQAQGKALRGRAGLLGEERIEVRYLGLRVVLVVEFGHGVTAIVVAAPHRVNVALQEVLSLLPPPCSPGLTVASHTRHAVCVSCR